MTERVADLRAEIEAAEEAYEFLIAYAGRGLDRTQPPGTSDEVRDHLERLSAALDGALEAARGVPDEHDLAGSDRYDSMLSTLAAEIDEARTVIDLLAAQDAITSAQVDNMNGMSVFQSVMMKLFFLDELTAHLG